MEEKTGGVSRRRFLVYIAGVAGAALAALAGFGIYRGRQEKGLLPEGYADMILQNGKILTVDPDDRIVDAVAVKDGKVFAAGSRQALKQLIGPSTKQVDLKGKSVTPGFIDSHLHMHYYGKQFQDKLFDIRFPTIKTRDELIEAIKKRVGITPEGSWVAGNQGFVVRDPPNRWQLDEIAPNHPVFLLNYSGQFAVVNSRALEIAGITKDTPDPYSAVIEKDATTGELTGFLYHYPAIDLVRSIVPGYGLATEEDRKGFVLIGAEKCFEAGYTSIQDVIVNSIPDVKVYADLAKEERLPINVYILLYVQSIEDAREKIGKASLMKGEKASFGGFKLAIDGGAAAGTALMYDRNTKGSAKSYPYHSQETLNEMVAMFHKEGYQVSVHVIGDEGIDMVLNAFEYAMEKYPREDPRHRMEHVIFPTPEALEKIKRLGVIVSTQPQIISFFGAQYEKAMGEKHMDRFLPLREMLEKGIHIAFGCDVPAAPLIEPKWALIGATTRWTVDQRAIGKEQSISMKEAIRIHTMGSAYAAFEETIRGSLEQGKLADMVVWSQDPLKASQEELLNIKAEVTIVDGKVVFQADGSDIKLPP